MKVYYISFSANNSATKFTGDMLLDTDGPIQEEDIKSAKKIILENIPDKSMTFSQVYLICIYELHTKKGE